MSLLFCKLTFFVAFATTHRATCQLFFSSDPHFLYWKCPTTSWGRRSAHFRHNNCYRSFNPTLSRCNCNRSFLHSLHEGAASFLFVLLWYVDLLRLLFLGVGDVAMLHLTINQLTSSNWTLQASTDFNNFTARVADPHHSLMRIRIQLFTLMRIRIWIRLLIKLWESTTPGLVLRCERLRLYFEPLKLQSFT